jgi:hypothetical protein
MAKVESIIAQMMKPQMNEAGVPISEAPRVTFPMPKNYLLPDGLAAGDLFNAVGTFRLDEAGLMELVQVDGMPVDPSMTPEQSEGDPNPAAPGAMGLNGLTNQVTPFGMRGIVLPRNPLNFGAANRMHARR